MVDAYPLKFPLGWKRTIRRDKRSSQFRCTFGRARDYLINEIRLLGGTKPIISSNLMLRNDGLPYAMSKQPEDTGVAVYFTRKNKEVCIPCDKWIKVEDNLYAVSLCINALRSLDRWGAKDMVDASFQGFLMLEQPKGTIQYFEDCVNKDMIENRYKILRKELHPDVGGTNEEFAEMQRQYTELKNRPI